jgi:hypothetical protein
MDFITQLPRSRHGYTAVATFVDKLSKMTHFAPTHTTVSAPDAARLFLAAVVRLHGWPTTLVSDRDPKFTSAFWTTLFKEWGTKLAMSTAYHPQTDGQSERANRTLEEMLRSYVSKNHDDWDVHLPTLEFALNNTRNPSTGRTPFELNYGFHPRVPATFANPLVATPNSDVNTCVRHMRQLVDWTRAALTKAAETQRRYSDRRRTQATFAVGDLVLLSTNDLAIREAEQCGKLLPLWVGPFKVQRVVNPNAYELELPVRWRRLHPVFNISRLRPYTANNPALFPDRPTYDRPPPELVEPDGSGIYVVEKIIGKQIIKQGRKNVVQYRVLWKGYPPEEATWEFAANLKPPAAGEDVWQMVLDFDATAA